MNVRIREENVWKAVARQAGEGRLGRRKGRGKKGGGSQGGGRQAGGGSGGQALCLGTFGSTFLLLLNNGEVDRGGDPHFYFVSPLKT